VAVAIAVKDAHRPQACGRPSEWNRRSPRM